MIKIFDNNVFCLTDGSFTYAFYEKDGNLYHSYYGKHIDVDEKHLSASVIAGENTVVGNDWAMFEIGEQGRGDFRIPSVVARRQGVASTDFKLVSYELLKKRPSLGMPSIRDCGETLRLVLRDEVLNAELTLYYSVCGGALVRHSEIKNTGKTPLVLCVCDTVTELPMGAYDIVSLDGRWGQECCVSRLPAAPGIRTLSSTRGFSSHQHNPFAAVVDRSTTEENGDAYGFSLIYSGNFAIRAERDEKSQLRICTGVNLMEGGISLEPDETFVSPETVSVYSDRGLGGMSRIFHKLYSTHLINPRFAGKIRPVVVNSWESVYFDFDEDRLKEFIVGASGLGIDTVVLDDGWFGHRDSDDSSLGDWFVDKRKLPNGLDAVIDCCKKHGMRFGIWFEPEAISRDSELYKKHPDWAIETKGRDGIEMRNQLMLDFSRKEVVGYIFDSMSKILSAHDISYVKWDANRHIADIPDVKKYLGCIYGVYDLYERLGKAFPDILIEGCASGGGRFDPAILYYSPMIWSSDDTDAAERAKIQYGLSLCYPLQAMSNHVSVCPNHQTGRTTPLSTRAAIASLGCLGYELNIADTDGSERTRIKSQVERYKRLAGLILNGELYRISDPFESGSFCEQVVSEDGKKSYAVFARTLNTPNLPLKRIKLRGLKPDGIYKIEERESTYTGSELMYGGICPRADGDFGAETLELTLIDEL